MLVSSSFATMSSRFGAVGGLVSSILGLGVRDLRAVVEDVVDRLRVLALLTGFWGEERFLGMLAVSSVEARMASAGAMLNLADADSLKAGFFEEGVDVPHLGESFNPGDRAELARTADEVGGDSSAAIRRMNHDALQQH